MKSFILLLILCAPLKALDITDWALLSNRRLLEVTFSGSARDETIRSRTVLYISERERGGMHEVGEFDFSCYVWSEGDDETQQKAEKCFGLLISAAQPDDLPADPKQVVTVRWEEGWVERKFPMKRVPAEIREMLLIMGVPKEEFRNNLIFVE